MQKRGISEAVSVMMLLAVIAIASYFALNGSSKTTIELERSVVDAIEQKGSQTQELVSIIFVEKNLDGISLELINYGQKKITIDKVFVDGAPSPFILLDSAENVFFNNTLPQREIMQLHVGSVGNSVQILTDSKNILKFTL